MNATSLEQYVDSKVASGEFRSREEFFFETARVYKDLEERHAGLKSLIAERIEEAARGEVAPLDVAAIKQELVEELGGKDKPR